MWPADGRHRLNDPEGPADAEVEAAEASATGPEPETVEPETAEAEATAASAGLGGTEPPVARVGPVEPAEEPALVRPYQWTAGRTSPTLALELEALVSTSEKGQDERQLVTLEHRDIASLCRHPHAVAEIAAKLSVPLGVVRVLLSDMAEEGLIAIHRTVADDDMAAHLVLMERVLSGLRRL